MSPSLQVGTSSVVYPAAMFAPQVAARGVPVAEFNMEDTPATMRFMCVLFPVRQFDTCSVILNLH